MVDVRKNPKMNLFLQKIKKRDYQDAQIKHNLDPKKMNMKT